MPFKSFNFRSKASVGYTYLRWLDHSLEAAGLKVESGNTLASELQPYEILRDSKLSFRKIPISQRPKKQ